MMTELKTEEKGWKEDKRKKEAQVTAGSIPSRYITMCSRVLIMLEMTSLVTWHAASSCPTFQQVTRIFHACPIITFHTWTKEAMRGQRERQTQVPHQDNNSVSHAFRNHGVTNKFQKLRFSKSIFFNQSSRTLRNLHSQSPTYGQFALACCFILHTKRVDKLGMRFMH